MNDPVTDEALARFIHQAEAETPDAPDDGEDLLDAPRVVFSGALGLDRAQEDGMMAWIEQRVREMEDESGRADYADATWEASASLADLDTFFGRRRLFEMAYHKRFDWRAGMPGIFQETNLHLPIIRRILQQQIARAQNYFFATEPWFSVDPQGDGPRDASVARRVNQFAQWKFRQAGARSVFEKAIKNAMIRGEGIVKCVPKRVSRYYEDIIAVAVDPASGEPLVATDGDYIQPDDAWIAAIDPATGQPEINAKTQKPVMLLSRARDTVMPDYDLVYEVRKVVRERVVYQGPDVQNVYYLDFLCPLTAASIEDADIVVHYYDLPATELAQRYLEATGDDEARRILDLLRDNEGAAWASLPAAQGYRPADGEVSGHRDTMDQRRQGMIPVAECYITYDANSDGRPESLVVVYNRETGAPIYYDYVDRVTEKGLRPFFVPRVNPEDGRWYGGSQVDIYWDLQMFIDLTMNRWNHSQMGSARVDFVNPEAVYEADGTKNFQLNTGRTYRLKPGKTADDALQSKYLNEIKGQDLHKQLEFFLQIANNMSGVMNANDAAMAGLDTTKLATSVRNMEKGGQELFAPLLSELEPGLSGASSQLLRILGRTMDEQEVVEFLDGDPDGIVEIVRGEITQFDWLVEMQLTRYKNEQELAQNVSAIDVLERFYAQPPDLQIVTAPMYINILKLFSVPHPDRLIQPGIYAGPGGVPGQGPESFGPAVTPQPAGGKSEELL